MRFVVLKKNGTPFWLFLRESKRETDIHLGGTDSQRKTSEFIRLLQDSLETSEAHGKQPPAVAMARAPFLGVRLF